MQVQILNSFGYVASVTKFYTYTTHKTGWGEDHIEFLLRTNYTYPGDLKL
jgi:hypothetical protein